MEIAELKSIWNQINEKLDRNWQLNLELIRRTNLDKVRTKMRRQIWFNGLTLTFYLFWALLFIIFVIKNWSVPNVAVSGAILGIWAVAISAASIHELELMASIDYGQPINELQKKLSRIKLLMIRYIRLAVWIFPLYFVFIVLMFWMFWGIDIVAVGDRNWIIGNVIISVVVFLPLAIWAHRKLSAKNAHTKWMNTLLRGNGNQIVEALRLIEEIEEFEQEPLGKIQAE